MNIGAILPHIESPIKLPDNNINCENEFDILMQQMKEETELEEMKRFLDETFHINTIITEYRCEKTDSEAQKHDISMLEQLDITGGRTVIISKESLLRMKNDSSFRQKVYKSIEDIPWSGKATGGAVKSNGVFIHEDGTGGYYLEFDWGEETEQKKTPKDKAVYSENPKEIKEETITFDDQSQIALWADLFSPFPAAYRKK